MFVLNDDLSIYATRGDVVFFSVSAEDDGKPYKFQAGDVVRIKVYGKKDAESVVLQKDFPVTDITENVEIFLSEEDTKIGEVISKPKDYWYEVELNPHDNPQTIIGYDEDGAKVFKLFPEGDDIPEWTPEPEDIPVVDEELDMTSTRPVQNQAVARAFANLKDGYERTHAAVAELHVTPQMFGAIGDGEADDTEAIQSAIDYCFRNGNLMYDKYSVYIPAGKYLVTRQLNVTSSTLGSSEYQNIKIQGAGRGATLLLANMTSDCTLLYCEKSNGLSFSDFSMKNISNARYKVDGLSVHGASMNVDLDNLFAVYFNNGFSLYTCVGNIKNCFANSCKCGFYSAGVMTATNFLNCYASQCVNNGAEKHDGCGYYVRGSYTSLTSCASDGNTKAYYIADGDVNMSGCGMEGDDRGIIIDIDASNISHRGTINIYGYNEYQIASHRSIEVISARKVNIYGHIYDFAGDIVAITTGMDSRVHFIGCNGYCSNTSIKINEVLDINNNGTNGIKWNYDGQFNYGKIHLMRTGGIKFRILKSKVVNGSVTNIFVNIKTGRTYDFTIRPINDDITYYRVYGQSKKFHNPDPELFKVEETSDDTYYYLTITIIGGNASSEYLYDVSLVCSDEKNLNDPANEKPIQVIDIDFTE